MTPVSTIHKTEYVLLDLLRQSLHFVSGNEVPNRMTDFGKEANNETLCLLHAGEWTQLIALADRHEVLPLLGPVLESEQLPQEQRLAVEMKTARTIHTGIQLQVLTSRLTALLEKEGIQAITMKGCAVSRFYPVPEFRKSTDIDLFIDGKQNADRAVQILCANGFSPSEEWHANHHLVLISEKKDIVEIHTSWAEDFKEKYLNQYLEKMQRGSSQHCGPVEFQGLKICAYDIPWQGFYLMIHMLQHFVGSGFGLRNLCDWVVLWENCDDEKARADFWKMVCESGTVEFAKAVTGICTKYLGMFQEKSPIPVEHSAQQEVVEALLRDIFDAGEFGYSEEERMVGMNGNSLAAYVKEFHHQMHINFPETGRIPLFWPGLWIATLVRFLRNNKKLNRAPISVIMKKAGERGALVSRLTPHQK